MERFRYETEAELIERLGAGHFVSAESSSLFIPKTLLVQWHVTERCNLRCTHCYQNEDAQKREISFESCLGILDQIIQMLKTWCVHCHFNLTGGEPFIQSWFPAFLKKIYEHRDICSFAVLSNGTLLNDDHAKQLKALECQFVQVSIDGAPATHDAIRGRDAFARAAAGLECLHRHGVPTMISFTSHKQNALDFDAVAELGHRLGAGVVWSDRVLPFGRGEQLNNQMMQPHEVKAFFETMYEKHRKFKRKWFTKTSVKMHRALQFLTRLEHKEKNVKIYSCAAGQTLLTILPTGELLPCRRMPIVVGNLLNQNIEELYQNSRLLRRLRDHREVAKGCEGCDFRQSCNGGLRCLSYAYYGNPFIADPQCFKIHTQLPSPNLLPQPFVC